MVSTARLLFRDLAAPSLSNTFSDSEVSVEYEDTDGNTTTLSDVIWRSESEELVEDSKGNLNRMIITQAVLQTADVAIDLEGTITKDGVAWDIDAREGRGIEAKSPTFTLIHLMRPDPKVRSVQNKRL